MLNIFLYEQFSIILFHGQKFGVKQASNSASLDD